MKGASTFFLQALTESPRLYFSIIPRRRSVPSEHLASSRRYLGAISEFYDAIAHSSRRTLAFDLYDISVVVDAIRQVLQPHVRDNASLLRVEVLVHQAMRAPYVEDELVRTASFASGYFRGLSDASVNSELVFKVEGEPNLDRLCYMVQYVTQQLHERRSLVEAEGDVLSDTA